MRWKKRSEVSADIAEVRGRIARWRATRTKRSPMPAPLWEAAARLAERHGIYPIARGLRVNYDSLKCRALAGASAREPKAATRAASPFIEVGPVTLPPVGSPPATGPAVELVDARGAKLTMHLGNGDRLDIVGLARAFWARRA